MEPPLQAVTFGPCFGMYHEAAGDTGIVLLAPFGVEALACHKSMRLLAEDCASRGFPTLRFDFPGTGDSLGDEATLDAIDSRCKSALAAIDWLKATSGVKNVILVGLRLGASIAAFVGKEAGVQRVVLMAPIVSGKRYVREMRSLFRIAKGKDASTASLSGADSTTQASTALLEFDGFRLSQMSLDALNRMDLKSLPPPATDIMILAPSGQLAAEDLGQQWRTVGARVTVQDFLGFNSLLTDPSSADPPRADLTQVADWIGTTAPAAGSSKRRVETCLAAACLQDEAFIETAAQFGADNQVFGILCQAKQMLAAAPVLILLNTGANSHVGWGRQTVEIARRLVSSGISTLRFDSSGIGETPDLQDRPTRVFYVADSRADVVAAVDWLETQGFRNPALSGICSGAYLAFQAAAVEPRLSAVAMINLQKFVWDENARLIVYSSVNYYLSMLRQPAVWLRLLKGDVDTRGILRTIGERILRVVRTRFLRAFNPAAEAGDKEHSFVLDTFVEFRRRGLRVLMAYSLGDGGIDEMKMHLGRNGARIAYPGFKFAQVDALDHNFTSAEDRALLVPLLRDFILDCVKNTEAHRPAQGAPAMALAAE
jgi:alpha/beta superfamily hydrolase